MRACACAVMGRGGPAFVNRGLSLARNPDFSGCKGKPNVEMIESSLHRLQEAGWMCGSAPSERKQRANVVAAFLL